MPKEDRPFDDVDALAADICSAVKRRGEEFESDEELRSYLDEDGIGYDPHSLAVALRQLEEIGRIARPVLDRSSVPRSPGCMSRYVSTTDHDLPACLLMPGRARPGEWRSECPGLPLASQLLVSSSRSAFFFVRKTLLRSYLRLCTLRTSCHVGPVRVSPQ